MSDQRRKRHNSNLKSRSISGENIQKSNRRCLSPSPCDQSSASGSGKSKFNNDATNQNGSQNRAYSHRSCSQTTLQRTTSYDRVRKIVQEEGRTARNLIAWNVPMEAVQSKPKTSSPVKTIQKARQLTKSDDCVSVKSVGSRPSSVNSVSSKKVDLRARYWAFLFDNLQRAVDEIYNTCEADESVVECKEVIMLLEQCTKDFQSLIDKLNVMAEYEHAKEGGKRPTSLAWEVRKTSPGKCFLPGSVDRNTPSPAAQRCLNFMSDSPMSTPPPCNSWADKVRGMVAMPLKIPPPAGAVKPAPTKLTLEEDDGDGWETVSRRTRSTTYKIAKNISNNVSNAGSQMIKAHSQSNIVNPCHPLSIDTENRSHRYVGRHNLSPSGQSKNMSPGRERAMSGDSAWTIPSPREQFTIKNQPTSISQKQAFISMPVLDDPSILSVTSKGSQVLCTTELSVEIVESDDDILADKLEDALATALDAEDSLTNQLEAEQEQALQTAIKEEASYLAEIEKEEEFTIDMESEPETENESDLGNTMSTLGSLEFSQKKFDWETMLAMYESEADYRQTHTWEDMVEEDEVTESRAPGHAVHMHEKLSSPSRKRSVSESKKRHEQKQAKAQELREKLNQDKAERLRDLFRKVAEVRAWKNEILNERRLTMERKLQRAEEKRQIQLKNKVKKAHEEENKANEIAFINTLEAQNKRHDILSKHKGFETRLHDLQEERQRKLDEKAAKEAAVEERRKALEAERLARLQEMQEKRKLREEKIELQQQEKEKERLEAARTKEKEREGRIAALNAQQQLHIEELQKKIQEKQTASTKRHNENLDNIRLKAFEMSVLEHSTEDHNDAPRLVPYDKKKLCAVCNVLIPSEVYLLSHLRGKKHQESLNEHNQGKTLAKKDIEAFNLKHIKDAPMDSPDLHTISEKERYKAMKKRCKKLRQRMMMRGVEYENSIAQKQGAPESKYKAKLQKFVKDINKLLQTKDQGPWPQNKISSLDRGLHEIKIILDRKIVVDQISIRIYGGLTSLSRLLLLVLDATTSLPAVIPQRCLVNICVAFKQACKGCYENCHYMLFSNKISSLVDILNHQLMFVIPEDNGNTLLSTSGFNQSRPTSSMGMSHIIVDPVATSLMQLVATILSCLSRYNTIGSNSKRDIDCDTFMVRANDIISYIISAGVVDKISNVFGAVRGSINDECQLAEFLQHSMGLLVVMSRLVYPKNPTIYNKKQVEDTTQLILTFQATELVGVISLLYDMLLHSEAPARCHVAPPELPVHTTNVTLAGLRLLNHMAMLNLNMLQGALGEEGISLQFRHIASYLLWYCSHCCHEDLLHEVILCVGYFTVQHPDNQVIILSGQPPTVLQQLCSLPFQYFSDPRLMNILFPTLIMSCCNNEANQEILEQELSCALLSNFIEEKLLEMQQRNLLPQTSAKLQEKEVVNKRFTFINRFPQEKWVEAKDFFTIKKQRENDKAMFESI